MTDIFPNLDYKQTKINLQRNNIQEKTMKNPTQFLKKLREVLSFLPWICLALLTLYLLKAKNPKETLSAIEKAGKGALVVSTNNDIELVINDPKKCSTIKFYKSLGGQIFEMNKNDFVKQTREVKRLIPAWGYLDSMSEFVGKEK